jgi:tetraacyldisaccharide 4'-kinase
LRAYLIYLLYWTLQALAFPFLLLYLGLRVARNRAYLRRLSERFGFLPRSLHRTVPGAIWLHAVSVGESITAVGLIQRLKQALPHAPVYVSCTTLAGRAMAEQKLAGLASGVFYAPIDYRFCVRRVLRALKPAVVVVMETEIWPNLYRDTRLSGARMVVVNGRISDQALPRYRRFAWFFREVLQWPDVILAQDVIGKSRYDDIMAPRAIDAGNLKYDFDPAATTIAEPVRALLDRLQPKPIWIAASTMPPARDDDPDEDDIVLDTFTELATRHAKLLLILVPRRPERFQAAADRLAERSIPFVRRSQLTAESLLTLPGVLLVDTIGELSGLFRIGDVVFMGGTFPHRGGHNILEPAAFGVPIVTGPHMENFTEIASLFQSAKAVKTVSKPCDLGTVLEHAWNDLEMGQRGREISDRQRGATARAVAHIRESYDRSLVHPPWFNPLSVFWRLGVAVDRSLRSARGTPSKPVISVGNLSMGGSGKTPFVLWLAGRLTAAGYRPAALMRGYRRESSQAVLALPRGAQALVSNTGEEAQLVLRVADAGIGSNRREAMKLLETNYGSDVFILDDGFQHWPLARSLDIVLIDAIDPFRNGLPPRGQLREPFSSLARAHIIVLTRTQPGFAHTGLVEEIRRHNPSAPLFRARVAAVRPQVRGRVGAFCGLGQPESFRRTLRELGIEPEFFREFPDHHHYSAGDLQSMAADTLLTTEKDLANIAPELRQRVVAVPMHLEFDDEAALWRAIEAGCLPTAATGA